MEHLAIYRVNRRAGGPGEAGMHLCETKTESKCRESSAPWELRRVSRGRPGQRLWSGSTPAVIRGGGLASPTFKELWHNPSWQLWLGWDKQTGAHPCLPSRGGGQRTCRETLESRSASSCLPRPGTVETLWLRSRTTNSRLTEPECRASSPGPPFSFV